jgi:uncharacterized protein (DUF983 family)
VQHDRALIHAALSCRCPRCGVGSLFASRFDLRLNDRCSHCGLNLATNDNGDGPAVFLIFVLGFLLVPLAVLFDVLFAPPLWVHAILWGVVALGLTLGALKPLKSYIIALQFKHRPGDWNKP